MSTLNSGGTSKSFKSPVRNDGLRAPIEDKKLIEEYQTLRTKESSLDIEISHLSTSAGVGGVNTVMNLLHQYNEIKDATQVVLGRLAAVEGQTLKEMHERFGINDAEC